MDIYEKKGSIIKTKELFMYTVFTILLLTNYFVNNSIYSFLILACSAFLAMKFNPIMLLIPCMLADTIQGYFMITKTLSFNRLLALIFIGSCLLHYRKIKIPKFHIITISLSVYVFFSSFWSVTGSFNPSIAFMITALMIILLSSCDKINRKDFYSLVSVSFLCYGLTLIALTLVKSGGLNALKAVFDDSINANTICMSLALSASVIFGSNCIGMGFNKIISYGFVGMSLVAILFIGSRSALFGLLASIVATLLVSSKYSEKTFNPKKVFAFVAIMAAILAVIILVMQRNPAIYYRFTFSSANRKDMSSVMQRTDVWKALIQHIIPQNLFFGVGFGLLNVKKAVEPYVLIPRHAHNMYLAILSETGIFGTILFALFFAHYMKKWILSKKIDKIFIASILVLPLVNGMGEEIINQRWFWLSFGLCDVLLTDGYQSEK